MNALAYQDMWKYFDGDNKALRPGFFFLFVFFRLYYGICPLSTLKMSMKRNLAIQLRICAGDSAVVMKGGPGG